MKSMAEYLATPEQAAAMALSLLQGQGGVRIAAVWRQLGEAWQLLAAIGATDALPSAETLAGGGRLEAGCEAMPLRAGEQLLGWLVWRGDAGPALNEAAALLCAHLLCARLGAEQAASRAANDALLDISQLAEECGTIDQVLPCLHRQMMRLMDASNFYIALYDDEAQVIHFPFYVDQRDPAPPASDAVFPLAGQAPSLTAWLIRGGKPVVLSRERLLEVCQQEGLSRQGCCRPAGWARPCSMPAAM